MEQEQNQTAARSSEQKKKQSLGKMEQSFLDALCEKIQDPVIHARLCYLFEWYSRKAQRNKHWYHATRVITYVIPCLITLISVYAAYFREGSIYAITGTATLSALLVAVHHVVDHFRFYENWVRYRDTAEKLKQECEYYLNHCEEYAKRNAKQSKQLFARRIERIAKSELSSWENLVEESHKPFREENQNALQSGVNTAELNQLSLSALEEPDPALDDAYGAALQPETDAGDDPYVDDLRES